MEPKTLELRPLGGFVLVEHDLELRTAFVQEMEEDQTEVGGIDLKDGRLLEHVSSFCC